MRIQLRVTQQMLDHMRADLRREHPVAMERVGFLYCRFGKLAKRGLVVLAHDYSSVDDEDYIDDQEFGAVIGSNAFRLTLQSLYQQPLGVFHVHMHDHRGVPSPSLPDLSETAKFVPEFFHGRSDVPHGAIILSSDRLSGRIWLGERKKPVIINEVRIVGAPMQSIGGGQ